MMNEHASDDAHPAARRADQLAWAIWIDDECYAVVGDSEAEARAAAADRHDGPGGSVHVDGPFRDAEPGVWEFEFVTEHRERVVVEAPTESYAEESADAERTHRGQYVQTVHTESRRLNVNPNPSDDD